MNASESIAHAGNEPWTLQRGNVEVVAPAQHLAGGLGQTADMASVHRNGGERHSLGGLPHGSRLISPADHVSVGGQEEGGTECDLLRSQTTSWLPCLYERSAGCASGDAKTIEAMKAEGSSFAGQGAESDSGRGRS